MSDIKEELESFVEIMIKAKQQISGVHFEVTPYNVTECLDSREDEASSANFSNYRSTCDPRVNYKQSF
jgi:3-deoxy-7-phosphoheptulonate synthase